MSELDIFAAVVCVIVGVLFYRDLAKSAAIKQLEKRLFIAETRLAQKSNNN